MSRENVEIVRDIYSQWARGNIGAAVETFDPEIIFESYMPDAEDRVAARGPEAIRAILRRSRAAGASARAGVPVGLARPPRGRARPRALAGEGLAPLTLHEARHTYASLMIAADVNAKALSRWMGHANIGVTFDLYGHLMPGSEAEGAARLAAYLARGATSEAERVAVTDCTADCTTPAAG
jgi:integrase